MTRPNGRRGTYRTMHTADHDLSEDAQNRLDSIVAQMTENDRENERLRREMERVVSEDAAN